MTDEDFRDLIESAHLAHEVQAHPGWRVIRTVLLDQIDARNRWLLNGHAKSLEDYRANAGWIQGAQAALHLADRLDEKVEAERKRREETQAA